LPPGDGEKGRARVKNPKGLFTMATQSGVWGIDLGQCALKALRVENLEGTVTATAFDYVEHPKILSQPDADPDQLTREALEKFLSRNSLRGDTVVISVPGQSGLARFVKLPPVEEKKIVDIVKFEAKQQIPFNLEEVVWDYQKIGTGQVTDGFAMDTEIGLFAIKRDMVNRALQHFRDVNVEVNIVQMAPLALCNFVAFDLLDKEAEGGETRAAKKQCVVALDIGTDNSNLVITDGNRIIWQRPIPLGGNHFTRALTKDLKLTFAKAEHLKRNATKSVDKNFDLKKILTSLKPVLNDFVGEVQRSLGYFMNTHRDAQIEYMVGLGNAFRLPGLQRFLGEKLQLDVRKLQKLERLSGDSVITQPAYTENVLSFAVAYGLALQGLTLTRLRTNLLPQEIRTERLVRAKKPWAVAAASGLLLGVAGLALGYGMEYRAFSADIVKRAEDQGKAITSEAGAKKKAWDDEGTAVDKEATAVKSIIAGSEERLNWLLLNQYVADHLPRPDGSNLVSRSAVNKYVTQSAKLALDKLRARQAGSKASDKTPDKNTEKVAEDADSGVSDLIQVNVEAMDCRYCDDLAAFWDGLKKKPDFNIENVRPQKDPKDVKDAASKVDPPEANTKGWVVELRGYTYNSGKKGFVLDTLVTNLAGMEILPAGQAAAGTTTGGAATTGNKPAETKVETPVLGRVSHVILYQADVNAGGKLLQASQVGSLITAGGGGGESGMGGSGSGSMSPMPSGLDQRGGGLGGGGGTGGGRASWTPLTGAGGAGLGGFGGEQRSGGGSGGFGVPPAAGGSGSGSGGMRIPSPGGGGSSPGSTPPGGMGVGESGSSEAAKRGNHDRTEFIVLFIWREPTPSDALMKPVEETPAGGGGLGGQPTPPTSPGQNPSPPAAGGTTGSMTAGGKLTDLP
jgi:type IV pilus assembly protein PilM